MNANPASTRLGFAKGVRGAICWRGLQFQQRLGPKHQAGYAPLWPLNIPDPFRSISGLAGKGAKNKAGGLRRLSLLLFALGIVLMVDLQGPLVYNVEQQW